MFFKKQNNFPIFLIVALVFILGIHIVALVASLYYLFSWLDIVLHFVGGFWFASLLFYVFYYSFRGSIRAPVFLAFFILVSGTAFAGVAWEFFEFAMDAMYVPFLGLGLSGKALLADTLLDLLMDMAGGASAASFLLWKKKIA